MQGISRSKRVPWAVLTLLGGIAASAQQRPPAVPLIAHNPYFSVWSMSDKLTDTNTRHWTGAEQPLTGFVRVDGNNYRFMGADPRDIPSIQQASVIVTPTRTIYRFQGSNIELTVQFFTPAFPDNLDVLSRPATYVIWEAHALDGKDHDVDIYFDVDARIAVNTADQPVTWGRSKSTDLIVLNAGSRDQQSLNRSGDNLRIDWGYFHLAVPESGKAQTSLSINARQKFLTNGTLPNTDSMEMPLSPTAGAPRLAVEFPLGKVGDAIVTRHVIVSYTQGYAIEYLNRRLREYWQHNGTTEEEMLANAEHDYSKLDQHGRQFDAQLELDMESVGGKSYAALATLAYRQALAAYGFVADVDGKPLMFPKENFSNGCIGTVDVLYPAAPLFLLLNPDLLEAQLTPVLDYATLPRWKWPFAPHDLGQYPLANGQVYGGGERTEEDQMPIEETGNLLILAAALGQAQGDWHVARKYWPLFTTWANYLRDKGLDPENQLSTDDFAGHLAHNANLSIKAIEGLGAYAIMARGLGLKATTKSYMTTARTMATKWEQLARDGDHYKLAFDKPGTWSQKYNLVWDDILDLHLFPSRIKNTELSFYQKQLDKYGLPLDNRADYTKLDWELWTASLADSQASFTAIMTPIATWLSETSTRVPLTDWYDTKTGNQVGFQARSVVGGIYIKALRDKDVTEKWHMRARRQ
jgi:Domain of unknown function (DUF4965)/Domain of unknown function (DUF5127)/Domain of unknown function (DUF1793)/Domain of unknown function (DUF4964)